MSLSKLFSLVSLLILVVEISTCQVIPDGTYQIDRSSQQLSQLGTKFTISQGRVTFTECNRYNCSVQYDSNHLNGIKIARCMSTRMYCPGSREYQISSFLQNEVTEFRIFGSRVQLRNCQGTKKLILRRIA